MAAVRDKRALLRVLCIAVSLLVARAGHAADNTLTVLVMDPLARPLSCPCVQGHAQRRYEVLASYLQARLKQPVRLLFSDDLTKTCRAADGKALDVIIGKHSVVTFDAKVNELSVRPVMRLSGKDGKTTLTGLFMVRRNDPARKLADLAGYTVLFGRPEHDEKFAAAVESLHRAGVAVPKRFETRPGCSDSATEVLERQERSTCAVISSYAAALLEGCGTIERGALRVVGETEPVPFVTVFFTERVNASARDALCAALAAAKDRPDLLAALESRTGFVAVAMPTAKVGGTERPVSGEAAASTWPGWRGRNRDGQAAWLPDRLPQELRARWTTEVGQRGLAGLAATDEVVVVGDRNAEDTGDCFHCLDARTGKTRWTLNYRTLGRLKDYGNAPRATPMLHAGKAYLLGGLGDLYCVDLRDGRTIWSTNLVRMGGVLPTWGYCATPLIVDGRLIVNPGGKSIALAALDCQSGKELWRSPGLPAAYASFIVGTFGGVRQIVGYDEKSLGGWDPATGHRLWTLVPPERGDFNVPTPIDAGNRLIVASENNGTRLYEFNADGTINAQPVGRFSDLSPDSSTPVLAGGRLVGCWDNLYCLDADRGLHLRWSLEDDSLRGYASVIASRDKALVTCQNGELLLVRLDGTKPEVLSRLRVSGDDAEVLSHPALVGTRLYARDMTRVVCLELAAEDESVRPAGSDSSGAKDKERKR